MGDDDTPSSSAVRSPSEVPGGGMTLKECQDIIHNTFSDPKVRLLLENLEKSGCSIGTNFIRAVNCKGSYAGGFLRGKGIIICGNHLQYRDDVEQAVIHELIHAYDDCRAANLDWDNSAHRACSEIRANHLSGDCHLKRELLRGYLHYNDLKLLRGHEQVCVKRRAMKSLASYDSPADVKLALEAVWSTCYNDVAPFDRAP